MKDALEQLQILGNTSNRQFQGFDINVDVKCIDENPPTKRTMIVFQDSGFAEDPESCLMGIVVSSCKASYLLVVVAPA